MNPTRMIFADQIRNGMVLATKCGRAECCPWPASEHGTHSAVHEVSVLDHRAADGRVAVIVLGDNGE